MGIVNVTPDSFSDGGAFLDSAAAIEQGKKQAAQGASMLDIGGESTRPGAAPVSPGEEQKRILPVIEALKDFGVLLSVDTRHASTMEAAIAAGAGMVNDITALTGDPDSLRVVADSGAYVCLMHMQGTPQSMQRNPQYGDVVEEVFMFLKKRVETCVNAGIDPSRIVVDPGIGFGKTVEHNLSLLKNLARFHDLGMPLLLGASRKSFIAWLSRNEAPEDRLAGSLAVAIEAARQGAHILRVHDVAATRQALDVWHALAAPVVTEEKTAVAI